MSYADIDARLKSGGTVILDGGTGSELERRGARMDPKSWCGPASLENTALLETVHRDYIVAGAEVITTNTFASSRIMLANAGFGDQFAEINRAAARAAMQARAASGRDDVLVAGCLAHMFPQVAGTPTTDPARTPAPEEMADAFEEMATLLAEEGCDLIILEMMFHPDRMSAIFQAAADTGLPVWAGFSARRGGDGRLLSHRNDLDMPFEDLLPILKEFDVAAAGIMHTASDAIGEVLEMIRTAYDGPLMAYPDSGYFKMPNWQFEEIIPAHEFARFTAGWIDQGAQIVGGCCGLSPEHIAAVAPMRK